MLQFHLPRQHNIVFNDDKDLDDVADLAQHSIGMLMGWFKVNQVDPKANGYTYAEFPNIVFGIKDPKSGLGDKNEYALVDFLLCVITLRRHTT